MLESDATCNSKTILGKKPKFEHNMDADECFANTYFGGARARDCNFRG